MRSLVLICLLLPVGLVTAQGSLKDPRERDEDISGVQLGVHHFRNDDGFYEYQYSIENPEASKGVVSTLRIDLRCDRDLDDQGLPDQDDGKRWNIGIGGNAETRLSRVPAIIRADEGAYGIAARGKALWTVSLEPGESANSMRIISPLNPGMRSFQIDPRLNADPRVWDYETVEAEDDLDSVPSTQDFRVTGIIEGPACPGVTSSQNSPRFRGTPSRRSEMAVRTNTILSYSEPLRDRLAVPEDQETFTLTIHYHDRLDPESFQVVPERLRSWFNPEPGTSETVGLPLDGARNDFRLKARAAIADAPGDRGAPSRSVRDEDAFEVRRPGME